MWILWESGSSIEASTLLGWLMLEAETKQKLKQTNSNILAI